MKVLWLCSWYPNRIKAFDGDFIQRHARAVSLLHEVTTIFVKKDDFGEVTADVLREEAGNGNLKETRIYYKPKTTGLKTFDRWKSDSQYRSLFMNEVDTYISNHGKPDIIHVHVTMKAGLIAMMIKKKYGIPYLLSEHWTGFLQEAKPGLRESGLLFRAACRQIIKKAEKITAVSKVLADALADRYKLTDVKVIPNVVDTNVFKPEETVQQITRFIHISTMTYQKNIEHILEAFKHLSVTEKFSLLIYTPYPERCHDLVKNAGLNEFVTVRAEVPQSELAKDLRMSDALVLYSRYETFGCVVIEANACGIPAILSDLPVFREYSIEGKTALFAEGENPDALVLTLQDFLLRRNQFNKSEISGYIQNKFSYETIAKEFSSLYSKMKNRI